MITGLDAFLLVGILASMLLSSEPKKSAIALVLSIAASVTFIDYLFNGWIVMYLTSLMESMAAITLLSYSRKLVGAKDRLFFYMMAAFLLVSASTVVVCRTLYRLDIDYSHSDYVLVSYSIALSHLLMMISFSDGIGSAIRALRNNILARRSMLSGYRS